MTRRGSADVKLTLCDDKSGSTFAIPLPASQTSPVMHLYDSKDILKCSSVAGLTTVTDHVFIGFHLQLRLLTHSVFLKVFLSRKKRDASTPFYLTAYSFDGWSLRNRSNLAYKGLLFFSFFNVGFQEIGIVMNGRESAVRNLKVKATVKYAIDGSVGAASRILFVARQHIWSSSPVFKLNVRRLSPVKYRLIVLHQLCPTCLIGLFLSASLSILCIRL